MYRGKRFDGSKVDCTGLTKKEARKKRAFFAFMHSISEGCKEVRRMEENRCERNAWKVRQYEARFRGGSHEIK